MKASVRRNWSLRWTSPHASSLTPHVPRREGGEWCLSIADEIESAMSIHWLTPQGRRPLSCVHQCPSVSISHQRCQVQGARQCCQVPSTRCHSRPPQNNCWSSRHMPCYFSGVRHVFNGMPPAAMEDSSFLTSSRSVLGRLSTRSGCLTSRR